MASCWSTASLALIDSWMFARLTHVHHRGGDAKLAFFQHIARIFHAVLADFGARR
jgi:hypothetical protein